MTEAVRGGAWVNSLQMDEVYDTIQHVDQSNIAQDIQLPMLSPQLTLACLLAFGASLMIPASPVCHDHRIMRVLPHPLCATHPELLTVGRLAVERAQVCHKTVFQP